MDQAIRLFDEMANCKTQEELNTFCGLMVRPFVMRRPEWRTWLLDRYSSIKWQLGLKFTAEDVFNAEGMSALKRGEIHYGSDR